MEKKNTKIEDQKAEDLKFMISRSLNKLQFVDYVQSDSKGMNTDRSNF